VDRVREIAAAIAALPAPEKQRLLRLLVDRGEWPEQASGSGLPSRSRQMKLTLATLPQPRPPDYILTFDGGSRGNPGLGYGSYAIRRVRDGAERLERLELGDGYTNNEAEYDTLIAALHDLISRIEDGGRQPQEFAVEVRGDSALVINQLQGQWKAKEPRMRERRDRCLPLLQRFLGVHLKLQPREESVRILGH
jgi:ribonuclease HI